MAKNNIKYTTLSPEVVCKKNAVVVNLVSFNGEVIDLVNGHIPEYAKQEYLRWYRDRHLESMYEPMWSMSSVQFVDLGRGINVANTIAIKGNEIFVEELNEALQHIFDFANKFESEVIIPRLGYGLHKNVIDDFVNSALCVEDVSVWVCDHPDDLDPNCDYTKGLS